ncbi:MAG: MBL fold metallo-hydrolase, partial [Hyphomicrobiaceae bacterium]
QRLALVDTGSGMNKGPTMGHLPRSLEALGVRASDIETVLLTHLHMDHAGGLTDAGGRAAFPNAELVVHRKEAEYWLDTPKEKIDARSLRTVDHVRAMVSTYGDRVRRVADGEGIAGVSAELASGHTPGHTVWLVTSGGQSALILGDVIHLAAVQLPRPDSAMVYDVNADGAVASRQRVLARLAKDGIIACGMHLPDPGFGRIHRDGGAYRFDPFG